MVGLCDTMASAAYAHEAIGALSIACRLHLRVESAIWSFDTLTRLDIRHASLRRATQAHALVVAANAALPLPSHVSSWLLDSLRQRDDTAPVIVALFEEDTAARSGGSKLLADLRGIASRWRAPVLCNSEFHDSLDSMVMAQIHSRNLQPSKPTNDVRLPAGCWRGGINE
jgi:hypothetical protein